MVKPEPKLVFIAALCGNQIMKVGQKQFAGFNDIQYLFKVHMY